MENFIFLCGVMKTFFVLVLFFQYAIKNMEMFELSEMKMLRTVSQDLINGVRNNWVGLFFSFRDTNKMNIDFFKQYSKIT